MNHTSENLSIKQAFEKLNKQGFSGKESEQQILFVISQWLTNTIIKKNLTKTVEINAGGSVAKLHKDELTAVKGGLPVLLDIMKNTWVEHSTTRFPFLLEVPLKKDETSLFNVEILINKDSSVTIAFIILVLMDIINNIDFE